MFVLLLTPLISHSLMRSFVILFIYSWVWLFINGSVHVFISTFVNSFIVSFIYIFMNTVLMNSSDLYCRCAKAFCWVKQRRWHHLVRHSSNQKHAGRRIVWDKNSASPLFVTASDRCCCSNSWVRPRIVGKILNCLMTLQSTSAPCIVPTVLPCCLFDAFSSSSCFCICIRFCLGCGSPTRSMRSLEALPWSFSSSPF